MVRYTVASIIVSLIIFAGIGCNNDKTELAWINEAGTEINNIIWADGDEQWSKDGGYVIGEQTEPKEVNKLYGTVVASIYDSGGWKLGEVVILETNSSSLSLNEGSSEVYTIDSVTP